MTVFPTSNLPVQTQTWGREVEKRLVNLDSSFRSAEINNVTRDSQMISNYRRLDAAVTQLTVVANQAQTAATQAQTAADDAADAAALAQTAADTAQDAIDGLGSLDEATSTYKINAANLTVGFLSGDRIQGGEIIGTTLKTANTGRRVEIAQTNTAYFDEGGNFTGRIIGAGTARGSTIEMIGPGTGMVGVWNEGAYITSQGGREVVFGGAGTVFDNSPINCQNGSPITVNGANITSQGGSLLTNNVTIGLNNITATSGSITGQTVVSNGSLSAGSISNSGNYTGNGFPTIASNTVSGTTTFAPNVFISSSTGAMARNTSMSERRAKENIEQLEFDLEAFIAVNPVTFNYKREAVSDDEQAQAVNLGFILDDFEDAGLAEFLVAQPFEGDEYKQLRYNLLYMYLHKVVQQQNQTIKSLEARLTALEGKVE